jgi:hypothetical protein
MTFEQLQARLYKTIQRDDFLVANDSVTNYGTFINEAIRECENRKSWTTMKETSDLVLTSGNRSVALPDGFKSLQNLRPPVHIVLNDPNTGSVLKPVNVTWQEVEQRRLWIMGGMAWDVQTWIERTSAGCTLNIASQAGEDITFRVKYYKYSDLLVDDGDENALELLYPRVVLTKAKEIAFEAINDFEAQDKAAIAFELLFNTASKQDNWADVAGREGRM